VKGTPGAFTLLDWMVLVGYFVGITAFGLWVSRKTRSSGGYFLGDRKLPWWVMVGQAGVTYHFGFATIWYQWKNMLITPFYWLMAPWYRRCGRTTIGELVGDRYGRGMALLYTLFALVYFVLCQGAMAKGAGKVISIATGGEMISANQVVVAMVAATLLYTVCGGLVASAYTDFVQGFLIIALSFMLIPAELNWHRAAAATPAETARLGGEIAGVQKRLDALQGKPPVIPGDEKGTSQFFDVYNQRSGVTGFMLLMLTLNGLIGITAQPHILTMTTTGSTERAGRIGQTFGSFVKRFCTIGWALTGLIVAALVIRDGATLTDPEHAFGYACLHLLGPGLVGLMTACVLAATMSSCSNLLVNGAALFTQNIYKEYFRAEAADRELLLVGRLSSMLLMCLGVGFALMVREVLQAFLFLETLPAFFGIAIMGGFLWRRANRQGAMAAVVLSFLAYYLLNYYGAGTFQIVYQWKPELFAWSMLVGVAALVVVSLLTRPEDPRQVGRFFDNQRRTTDDEGLPAGEPRPLAAGRGQDLLLLDLPGWLTAERWRGFFRRYREDLAGFVLSWLAVGLLIFCAWAIMQIGR
jgi:Na+/proline symporter